MQLPFRSYIHSVEARSDVIGTEMTTKAEDLLASKVGSSSFHQAKTLNLSGELKQSSSSSSSVSSKHLFAALRKFSALELLDLSDNGLKVMLGRVGLAEFFPFQSFRYSDA